MADLTGAGRSERTSLAVGLAVGLIAATVGLALARIAVSGWAPLAPDDARYLFVGLSILDGQGAVTPSGDLYLLRSPVYGLALALGSQLAGGDPLVGARVVAVVVALLGLLGAIRLAWLVAGPGAAVGTAVALAATPLVWQLLPSLRIDLFQTALVIGLLLVAWRPTVRRWAAAGVVLGAVVLVKETALPLLALPLALTGLVPAREARRLALVFVGAAVATAAWWWLVVWLASGRIFPANALAVIEARDVSANLRVVATAVPLLGVLAVAWIVLAGRARQELGARLLLAAAIGLVPSALYAASQGLNARNYVGLAVLSAAAVGIAGATLVSEARRRRDGSPQLVTRAAATVMLAAILAVGLVGPVVGQVAVPRSVPDRLADDVVTWLDDHVADGGRVAMPFREREVTALRRFGRTEVRLLPVRRVDAAESPETFLWMGLRDRQLFGYQRSAWVRALTDPPVAYAILVGPHAFTPIDLVTAAADGPSLPGLTPVAVLEAGGDRADILSVDAGRVAAGTPDVPLHMTAEAALVWLDEAGGTDAAARLLQAHPVVSGDALGTLLARLGDGACLAPAPAGATQLGSAGTCPG